MWNVVLCYSVIYLLYLLIGGGIFLLLQGVKRLPNIYPDFQNTSRNFESIKKVLLESDFSEKEIHYAVINFFPKNAFGYFTQDLTESTLPWTFFSSFFFSFQVLATIGYGGIAPQRVAAQVFTIIYALFGIPAALLFIKVIAQSFSESQEEIVWLLRKGICSERKWLEHFIFFSFWSLVLFVLPSTVFIFIEKWNFLEGLYFATTILASTGLGDYVIARHWIRDWDFVIYKLMYLTWMIHGLAFFSMMADCLARFLSRWLLFEVDIDFKKRTFTLHRVLVDPESLDLHFRLLKAEKEVKHRSTIWEASGIHTEKTQYRLNHLKNLALIAQNLKIATIKEMENMTYNLDPKE